MRKDFGFVNAKGERIIEEGDYYVMVKDKKIKIEVSK
ncbi:hypothetical protein LWM68_18005 [Niabella sp. W65]|nr:hypothetical protein [Niabella sp. W65]MCH7364473.1 hypothetical protein [Niabella sp. W65]ULT46518.1 hypothetical protein KRR40_36890 [Niabella sp. I65]